MAHKGVFVMVTLTMAHRRGDSLRSGIDAVYKAWGTVTSGRGYKQFRETLGVVGYVRAMEVTDGGHGWHPHVHALFFLDRVSAQEEGLFETYILSKWGRSITRSGHGFSSGRGAQFAWFVTPEAAAGGYLAKGVGFEVAYNVAKEGRQQGVSHWGLLDRAIAGDAIAQARWAEFERSMEGRRSIAWSRGLRARLGLETELTDEELLERHEQEGTVLAVLDKASWKSLARSKSLVHVMVLTSAHDFIGLAVLLDALHLNWWTPDSAPPTHSEASESRRGPSQCL